MGFQRDLPAWLVILVVSRDVLIVGAVILSLLMGKPLRMRPLFVSKANTAFQIALAGAVLANLGFGLDWDFILLVRLADSCGPSRSRPVRFTCASGSVIWPMAWKRNDSIMTLRAQLRFWVVALAILIGGLWLFSEILLPFLAGLVLAYFLDPVADALERLGLPRLAATLIIVLASVVALALALIVFLPMLGEQIAKLANTHAAIRLGSGRALQ